MPEGTVFFGERADPAAYGAAAPGAAGRDPHHQPAAFRDPDRVQGGAHGAGGARQDPGRLRSPPRACGAEAGLLAARASYLAGFAGTATRFGAAALRRADLRHHGALVHPGARRRERRPSRISPAPGPTHAVFLIDTYDTERRRAEGGGAGAAAGAGRHQASRACASTAAISRRMPARCAGILDAGRLAPRSRSSPAAASTRASCCGIRAGGRADRRLRRRHQPRRPRRTRPRSTAPTSCRNTPASPSASDPRARRPGPAASRSGAATPTTAAMAGDVLSLEERCRRTASRCCGR